jgi:hypothetical protein
MLIIPMSSECRLRPPGRDYSGSQRFKRGIGRKRVNEFLTL